VHRRFIGLWSASTDLLADQSAPTDSIADLDRENFIIGGGRDQSAPTAVQNPCNPVTIWHMAVQYRLYNLSWVHRMGFSRIYRRACCNMASV
jgi:hypothetical protein